MDLVRFIVNFFLSKKVFLITAFTCRSPELVRASSAAGMKVRVYCTPPGRRPGPGPGPGGRLPAYDVPREGVLLDVACPGAADVLQEASSRRAFIHRYTWLLLDRAPAPTRLEAVLGARVDVLPDADVTWAASDGAADVYRVKSGSPLVVTSLPLTSECSLGDMESLWNHQPTPVTRRKNLGNISITSGTIITQPQYFKGWSDVSDRQIDTYPKLTYPLLMLLADDLNFRHNMVQVDLYGEEYNGTFDGLAGALQAGGGGRGVELGVASMFMRSDRWRVLHFAAETIGLTGAFIFRQPPQSSVSNVFLLPFSAGVWSAGGGVVALATVLLASLARRHRLRELSLPEAATFAVGAVCQQGFHATPTAASVRVAMFSMLACAVFVFTAYSAKIVSLLQTPSAAIQTIEQLAASPLQLGVQETTYKKVYFAESREPSTQRLYRRKLLPLGDAAYMSVVEGVARLRTGLFAFQVETSSGYDIISKTYREEEKCGLKEIQAFKLPMVAVPIRKHSGYRDLVATRLRWQRETGLMGRARRVWLAERACCAGAGAGFRSVRVGDVLPALQILGAGAAVAVFLLACELLVQVVTLGRRRRSVPRRADNAADVRSGSR